MKGRPSVVRGDGVRRVVTKGLNCPTAEGLRIGSSGTWGQRVHDGEVPGYFPYDVGGVDVRDLGLTSNEVRTSLVRVHVVRPEARIEVMFLHGLSMDWTTWTPLLRAAVASGTPRPPWLLVDLPGFGRSGELAPGVDLDQVCAALVEVLDGLGVEQVDIVGHSMGGFAALHLASSWPDRVRSVASLNGAYATIVDVVNHPARTLLTAPGTWIRYRTLSAVSGSPRLQRVVGLAARTGLLRLSLAGLAAHPLRVPDSLLTALAAGARPASSRLAEATGKGYDYRARWAAITVPTLVGFGTGDRLVTDRDRLRLQESLPGASAVRFDDCAHLAPLEQPDGVLDALRTFWATDSRHLAD
jgi:pimeloyl-ACP methyl ester carboxylesterase